MAVELLLNCQFYMQHQRFTSFSSADHQEDKLFSLCLTRESDKVYVDSNKSKEDAIWSEALIATKSKEWSGFFQIAALSTVIARPISLHIQIVKLGYRASCTLEYVPVRFRT